MTRYIHYARTRSEAQVEALALLRQLAPGRASLNTMERETKAGDGATLGWTVTLQLDEREYEYEEAIRSLPTVYVHVTERETSGNPGNYILYLCEGFGTLPFFARNITDAQLSLPLARPLRKPEARLTAEDVHTAEGRRILESYFSYGYEGSVTEGAVALFREAPKDKKVYALFDRLAGMSLHDVEQSLEAGEYDGGGVDGELVLSELTGETYETEGKYLLALSDICGAEAVNKYKSELLGSYRFYSAYYYVRFLAYLLSMTEDYGSLAKDEPGLASQYKYDPTYLEELLGSSYGEDSTALDAALATYLEPYLSFRSMFDGLSLGRLAEYLGAPAEKLQEVDYKNYKDSLLW